MTFSPRLLLILLISLLTVSAGCSSSSRNLEFKDHSGAITPKAYADDTVTPKAYDGGTAAPRAYADTTVTPKAHTDDTATAQSSAKNSPYASSYYGGYYERHGIGKSFDASRWSEAELQAASFLHASNIYFYFDSSALTSDAKAVLRQKAERLKAFPQLYVLIAGHSDERGTDKYNIDLGERRAKAAYNYLVSLGVPATQLSTTSFGKRFPAVSGQNEEAWSKNRRDEFLVAKP